MIGGERAGAINSAREFLGDDGERVAQDQCVRVAHHILASCTKMDDSTRVRRSVPKGVHMRHHIMAEARFVRVGVGEIDVI